MEVNEKERRVFFYIIGAILIAIFLGTACVFFYSIIHDKQNGLGAFELICSIFFFIFLLVIMIFAWIRGNFELSSLIGLVALAVAVISVIFSLITTISNNNKEIEKLRDSFDVGYTGGSSGIALSENDKGTNFYFAECPTGDDYDIWILIFNPHEDNAENTEDVATIKIKYHILGNVIEEGSFEVGPSKRVAKKLEKIPGEGFSYWIEVVSSVEVFCERTIYFKYGSWYTGGHTSKGIKVDTKNENNTETAEVTEASDSQGKVYNLYFVEGSTQKYFKTYISLVNLSYDSVTVKIYAYTSVGSSDPVNITIEARSRYLYDLDKDFPGTEGVAIKIQVPGEYAKEIIAERVMYFKYTVD